MLRKKLETKFVLSLSKGRRKIRKYTKNYIKKTRKIKKIPVVIP